MKSLLPVLLCLSNVLAAQVSTEHYRGNLAIQGLELPLVLHIGDSLNILSASLDSPAQNAYGIEANELSYHNDTLRISIARAGIYFTGTYSENRDTLNVLFKQGYVAEQLQMERFDGVIEKPKRPQEPQEPFPYRVEEIAFDNTTDEVSLAGTLTLPEGEGPFDAVILVSGSGPQDRNEEIMGHKPFLVIADYLTRNGVAVLRYDERGVGASTGNFYEATTLDFAADASAAVDFLAERTDIERIGLAGHSEGGLVGPMVATQNKQLDFLILLAGPGVPGPEVLKLQQVLMAGGDEALTEADRKSHRMNEQLYAVPATLNDPEKIRARMNAIMDEHIAGFSQEELKEIGMSPMAWKMATIQSLTTPWFLEFLRIRPADYLKKVTIPVLAINGTLDMQVDADQNLTAIGKHLRHAGNADVRIERVEGLNHLFQHAETGLAAEYSTIEETFAPEVLQLMLDWLTSLE